MKARRPKPASEMRMNAAEFDRIMSLALRVKPGSAKAKKPAKPKRKAQK